MNKKIKTKELTLNCPICGEVMNLNIDMIIMFMEKSISNVIVVGIKKVKLFNSTFFYHII